MPHALPKEDDSKSRLLEEIPHFEQKRVKIINASGEGMMTERLLSTSKSPCSRSNESQATSTPT